MNLFFIDTVLSCIFVVLLTIQIDTSFSLFKIRHTYTKNRTYITTAGWETSTEKKKREIKRESEREKKVHNNNVDKHKREREVTSI
jgi:hypothetical protein